MKSTSSGSDQDASGFGGVAAEELKQFIERIERLEEEKAGVAGDIKDVFAELKGRGFDVKAVRTILKMRKQDFSERQEQEAILELYMQALGMLADTPLGRAAVERDVGSGRASERSFRSEVVNRVRESFAGLEGETVTVGRGAAPVLHEAAKRLRAGER